MSSTSLSSGQLAAGDYLLTLGRGLINAIELDPGTEVTIYDSNTTPSGKILIHTINAGTSSLNSSFNRAIRADLGVVVSVVGTGSAYVFYGAG